MHSSPSRAEDARHDRKPSGYGEARRNSHLREFNAKMATVEFLMWKVIAARLGGKQSPIPNYSVFEKRQKLVPDFDKS